MSKLLPNCQLGSARDAPATACAASDTRDGLLLGIGMERDTYGSASESSVRRLLATLLFSANESSLWERASSAGALMVGTSGTGGMTWFTSPWDMSCMDLDRPLRALNILESLRRCDDVSLLASSEPRLFLLSNAPSADVCMSLAASPWPSLLVTEVAEELMLPLEGARWTGAASELSLLVPPMDDVVLRARSTTAIIVREYWRSSAHRPG